MIDRYNILGTHLRSALVAISLLILLPIHNAQAGMLIAPDDIGLRSDLQHLNDAEVISIPLSSWPLSRADLIHALQHAEPTTTGQTIQVARLQRKLADQTTTDSPRYSLGVQASTDVLDSILPGFGIPQRAQQSVALGWGQELGAIELDLSLQLNSSDAEDQVSLDGSNISLPWGNWLLSVGAQPRWWGYGWESNLLLSTNARPVPALSLQRQLSLPFESPWLSWIGPWNLTTFFGELDDERIIDGAKLFGMRVAFLPHPLIDISLERTAMLGGTGRPLDPSTFWNMFIGKDNGYGVMGGREVGNISREEEPGNQIAGFSLRLRVPFQIPIAYYYQRMTEDATIDPTEWNSPTDLHGLEYWGHYSNLSFRAHYEYADTLAESELRAGNVIFNHHIYQTGYRYQGQSIGHSIDNDSLLRSMGILLQHNDGRELQITFYRAHLNRDGNNGTAPNSRSTTEARQEQLSLEYRGNYAEFVLETALHLSTFSQVALQNSEREAIIQLGISRHF